MRLLNEHGIKLSPRKTPASNDAALTQSTAETCTKIGPFSSTDQVANAEVLLKNLNLTKIRQFDDKYRAISYQVYLPPFSSEKLAEVKRRSLTRLGFKDHALMQDEGMKNAISLGIFSVKANAEARLRELADKKIKAKIQTVPQMRTRYWLEVVQKDPLNTADLLKAIDWSDPDVLVQDTDCQPETKQSPEKAAHVLKNAPS